MGINLVQWRSSIGCWSDCRRVFTFLYKTGVSCHIFDCDVCIPWSSLLVLTILLIIGGVELNPGPSESWCCYCTCCDSDEETEPLLQHGSRTSHSVIIQKPRACQSTPHIVPRCEVQSSRVDRKNTMNEMHDSDLESPNQTHHLSAEESQDSDFSAESSQKHQGKTFKSKALIHATSKSSERRFRKVKGFADMSGQLFEIKVAALLFVRGLNRAQKFHLATNMEAGCSLDDIVFTLGHQTLFLQLKHRKAVDKKIHTSQLIQINGEFSLFKYYKSYMKIREQWNNNKDFQLCGRFEDSIFVIYTNATLPQGEGIVAKNTEWQDVVTTGGNCFRITEQSHPYMFEWFHRICEHKQLSPNSPLEEQSMKWDQVIDTAKKLGIHGKTLSSDQFKELQSLGDLSSYREFLSQLWFCTGQASELELDNLIKQEIGIALGLFDSKQDKIYSEFLTGMQHWWKTSNKFLTESSSLWQNITMSCINSISKQKLRPLEELDVNFNDDILTSLKSKLPLNGGILNIVSDGSVGSIALSSLKIHQSLANVSHLMVNGSTLQWQRNEVLALWGKWCDVLIIVEDGGTPAEFLYNYPKRTLVYISEYTLGRNTTVFHDKPNMSELSEESRSRVLAVPVLFQGYSVSLQEIIGDDRKVQDLVSAELIMQLLQGNMIIIGDYLTDDLHYFIPRTLHCRHCVNVNILSLEDGAESDSPVIIALSGLVYTELQELSCGRDVDTFDKWSNLDTFESQNKFHFVIINGEEEYQKLAELCPEIHWLHRDGDTFIWKQSRGDMNVIQKHLHNKTCLYGNVSTVMDLPHHEILLSAEPGMGKSVLINHVAVQTKHLDPSKWVMKVCLDDFTQELDKLPDEFVLNDVYDFLLETAEIPALFKHIFMCKLENMENICLFFDGFDEITPIHSNKVTLMIKLLQTTKLNKLWVATRTVMRKRLEEDLSTLAVTLMPLSETEQQHFITNIWSKNLPDTDISLLNEFCMKLLQLVTRNLSDSEKQLTGIPLQAMVMAEVFENQLISIRETGRIEDPPEFDLLRLFKKFVDKKLSIFYERNKINTRKVGMSIITGSFKELFYQNHMALALVTVLTTEDLKALSGPGSFLADVNNYVAQFEEGFDRTGIITETKNGKPVFIHRTFAEYFAAKWFSRNYVFARDFMRERLFASDFQIIRYFLSRSLAKNSDLHTAVIKNDAHFVEMLLSKKEQYINSVDEGGRTPLHLAIMNYIDIKEDTVNSSRNDRNQIMEILLKHGADPNLEDEVLKWRPLYLAEKVRAWWVVNLLLQNRADANDLVETRTNIRDDNYVNNILGASARQGYVGLVQCMLKSGIHVCRSFTVVDSSGQNKVTMLHEAAKHGQVKLVQFLLEHGAEIDAMDSRHGRTPLMLAAWYGQLEVVNLLMKQGASVNTRDKSGYTALLLAFGNVRQSSGETLCSDNSLHYAAGSGNVEVVRYLLDSSKLDINCINNRHQTPLWCAAWGGQLSIVQMLEERGADFHIRDTRLGWTPLHVAAKWGYLEIVQYLVLHGASLVVQDNEGHTPLNIAVLMGHPRVVQFIQETYDRIMLCTVKPV